jgi:asparagine synthetase B (glutamine-hydrolysing)
MASLNKAISNVRSYAVQKKANSKISEKDIEKNILDALEKDLRSFKGQEVFFSFSGGIDSSLLVALTANYFPEYRIIALTIGSPGCQDIIYSKKVASFLKIQQRIKLVSRLELEESLLRYEKLYNLIHSERKKKYLPLFLLSEFISENTNQVITGEGLDELAGGYLFHQDPVRKIKEAPFVLNFTGEKDRKEKYLMSKIVGKKLSDQESRMAAMEFMWYSMLGKKLLLNWKEFSRFLSFKVRFPYLDEKVINVLNRVPLREKVDKKEGKKIIRKILSKYLPLKIAQQKKRGLSSVFDS